MVGYFPHILRYKTKATNPAPTQNGSGNWVKPVVVETTIEVPCYIEYSKPGSFFRGIDGNNVYFDFIAYMPLGYAAIPYGHKVTAVTPDGEVDNTAKRFRTGTLGAQLWV